MSIQIILFDIGGIFFKWKDRWLFANIANKFGLPEQRLTDECKKELSNLRLGKISEKELWQRIGMQINSKELSNVNGSLIHDFFKSKIRIDDSIFVVIKQLQKKNILMGILSNTASVMHSTVVEELCDMSYFDYEFLSYEIGMEKPSKEIFEYVTEKLYLIKKMKFCLLMIGCQMSNVAKNFGIKAIHFIDTPHLIADLTDLEIL